MRGSIIRAIAYGDVAAADVLRITQINPNSYQLRRQNPDLWTIDEISQLATALGHETNTLKPIRQLTLLLQLLPNSKQKEVHQRAQLTRRKLLVRQANCNNWKVWELQQIADVL
ncbi:hypothetical protein F5984_03635 [Rudanella paleaurantiibacter]|uniref:Uncharacterized protein n=1 Tax=Rudanella paleaurantiibacter TaxID=2614655 RepID=A0A7J5U655_9BACT|nr:hypothetical protein F5984_03635 [Rudanella paleaurantiibacter]